MSRGKFDIIALDRFVQATRDSGYRSTTSAVAELVDNSLQAEATQISIEIRESEDSEYPFVLLVSDNGVGMTSTVLRQSLRFGGSSRFDDRSGLGRYGMGLPNASLSQAKKVEVWTSSEGKRPIYTYLDVDEIASCELTEVPKPCRGESPHGTTLDSENTGTVIQWSKCDRLDNRRITTLEKKISQLLGRMYRYFIWDGVVIEVNGEVVIPRDPLYLEDDAEFRGATVFEHPLDFEIMCPDGLSTSVVRVTFTELPISAWHSLDNAMKRKMGITNGAGVSIIRGSREVDFGWFMMGNKRRENYDDWWRCEISFDPELDELFGITHTKQQIRPNEALRGILEPTLERVAKILNSRVRDSHSRLKCEKVSAPTEEHATSRFAELKPIPRNGMLKTDAVLNNRLSKKHRLESPSSNGTSSPLVYRIIEEKLGEKAFYTSSFANGHALAVVNQRHPFYKHFYRQLQDGSQMSTEQMRHVMQLLLMAAARAEGMATKSGDKDAIRSFRESWGEAFAVALDGVK
jgi:Histidine kinase-, DNA gyrase B-, and HSP90-like ATPase